MTPLEIAKSLIGTAEVYGSADNPAIMEMYSVVGHDWVEHDEVAWCAAFVGYCLERAGIASTRKLNARSYLEWGSPVKLADVRAGDIAVIPRGSSAWQGHVFFVDRIEGSTVFGLGGNQDDAVNIKRFPVSKVLGFRRAPAADLRSVPSVKFVQRALDDLGYHEVGAADGIMGSRTRGAILAFRADHGLPLVPTIDADLGAALLAADRREVAPSRANGQPEGSRIVASSNAQIGLGAAGAATVVVAQIAPALEQAEQAKETAGRVLDVLGLSEGFASILPWVGAAIFVVVIVLALRIRKARIDDHQTGRSF